ncbi:MAG: hypothetical protein WBM76_14785 [Woeseiaceae bacterium]|jgi:hypothetical protein
MENYSVRKALAELAVIIFGILIALFAESAWNDYQDRAEGREYLARLSAEIQNNLQMLDTDVATMELSCRSVETTLSHVRGDKELDPASALRFAAFSATYANAGYQRVTYDDLTNTGNLSLIDDASLREEIVSAYTMFFGGLTAWRPSKHSALRTTVLRALPREYIERVVSECLTTPADDAMEYVWTDCSTTPATGDAEAWLNRLLVQQEFEGYLAERAWQVCGFSGDMAARRQPFESLAVKLDDLAK